MASVSSTRPADVGLKREMGLIGATWSSETSIIGSGWLFGSYFAAAAVGSAAIIFWILAGIAGISIPCGWHQRIISMPMLVLHVCQSKTVPRHIPLPDQRGIDARHGLLYMG